MGLVCLLNHWKFLSAFVLHDLFQHCYISFHTFKIKILYLTVLCVVQGGLSQSVWQMNLVGKENSWLYVSASVSVSLSQRERETHTHTHHTYMRDCTH